MDAAAQPAPDEGPPVTTDQPTAPLTVAETLVPTLTAPTFVAASPALPRSEILPSLQSTSTAVTPMDTTSSLQHDLMNVTSCDIDDDDLDLTLEDELLGEPDSISLHAPESDDGLLDSPSERQRYPPRQDLIPTTTLLGNVLVPTSTVLSTALASTVSTQLTTSAPLVTTSVVIDSAGTPDVVDVMVIEKPADQQSAQPPPSPAVTPAPLQTPLPPAPVLSSDAFRKPQGPPPKAAAPVPMDTAESSQQPSHSVASGSATATCSGIQTDKSVVVEGRIDSGTEETEWQRTGRPTSRGKVSNGPVCLHGAVMSAREKSPRDSSQESLPRSNRPANIKASLRTPPPFGPNGAPIVRQLEPNRRVYYLDKKLSGELQVSVERKYKRFQSPANFAHFQKNVPQEKRTWERGVCPPSGVCADCNFDIGITYEHFADCKIGKHQFICPFCPCPVCTLIQLHTVRSVSSIVMYSTWFATS